MYNNNVTNRISQVLHDKKNRLLFELQLAKNDLKRRYSGSLLGLVWSFVPPFATICVYWFIFNIGFKITPNNGIPYLVWLMSGLIPWFFFTEAVIGIANCYWEYSYLVKKVVFDIKVIPHIKLFSALFIHCFFLFIIMYFNLSFGILPSIYYLQLIYYIFCLVEFVDSFGLILACLNVVIKDIGQLIPILFQFGIWLVPVMWDSGLFSEKITTILKLNPLFYIIQGYRDSLVYRVPVMSHIKYTIYFWVVVIIIKIVAKRIFNRSKDHFADLLV